MDTDLTVAFAILLADVALVVLYSRYRARRRTIGRS
jgi:hypothetical protein